MDHQDSNKLEMVMTFALKRFLGVAPPCDPQKGSLKHMP
jgi:hypothetical protein